MITAQDGDSQERALYAQLRDVLKSVRWLKRACLALMLAIFFSGFALWVVRHPQSFGL